MGTKKDAKTAITRIKLRTGEPNPETGCMEFLPASEEHPLSETRALYIKHEGKAISVLKLLWEEKHGEPPTRLLRHSCKNKRCVNPDHIVECMSQTERDLRTKYNLD